MALKAAIASGNWSNPATWNAGQLPRINDVVASNGFTVTIDQNITVVQLTNLARAIERNNPAMTSPTTPSGIVTSQPADNGLSSESAWYAFNGSGATVPSWYAGGAYPKWIAYEYVSPIAITSYSLILRGDVYNPRDWTFEAWDGTSWIVLHTVAAYTTGGSYDSPNFNNSTPYIKYRVNVTADRSLTPSLLIILEINLFEYGYTRQAAQGGGFIIGPNVTVTTTTTGEGFDAADIANGLIYSANSPSVSSFVGKIKGLPGNHTLQVTGTGTLNIVGNLFSGTNIQSNAVVNITSNAIVNITGNLAYFGGNRALNVQSSCTSAQVTITGDVYIGSFIWGGQQTISFNGGGTLNVIGSISIPLSSINAEIYAIVLNAPIGKTINFNHTGIITVIAPSYLSQASVILLQNSSGLIFARLDQLVGGNGILVNQASPFSYVFLRKIIYGDYGQCPLFAIRRAFLTPEQPNRVTFRNNSTNGAQLPSAPAPQFSYVSPGAVGGLPSIADVRFGITFGYGSAVGTAKIPNPNQVTFGVAVDNTFGNAVLTAASVWDYLISNITVENSIGMRLKNVSTPQITGEQLEAFLRLD
jgi:hypothetical protein